MNPTSCQNLSSQAEKWFDEFIGQLRADQIQLDSGIASTDKQSFYNVMMSDNQDDISMIGRQLSSVYFIKRIVVDYLNELNSAACKPEKLALNYSNSKVQVWAEIKDDDEETENRLLMIEAIINAKYHQFGFNISSTILEERDQFRVPSQYQPFLTN
jgi:hypothetical protein